MERDHTSSNHTMPIVIITGYPDSQMLDNILQHGPVTVLKKPPQVELLEQVQPVDLMKYGLIPEFVGRVPVVGVL